MYNQKMKLMRVRTVTLILIIGSLDEHYCALNNDASIKQRNIFGYPKYGENLRNNVDPKPIFF